MFSEYIQQLEDYLKSKLHSKDSFFHQPVFLTILELTILNRINYYLKDSMLPTLELHISQRLSFIFSQFSSNFTLNYNPRFRAERAANSYSNFPDDIDDTFSAWYALFTHDPLLVTPAHVSELLYSLESLRDTDNPCTFNTWYATDLEKWHSIDPIVLSALVSFFQNINIQAEELSNFVYNSLIDFKDMNDIAPTSLFYHSFPLAFYLGTRIKFDEQKSITLLQIVANILSTKRQTLSQIDLALIQAGICYLHNVHKGKLGIYDIEIIPFELNIDLQQTQNPLYIESIKSEIPNFCSSEYIDTLIQFESYFGTQYIATSSHIEEDLDTSDIDITSMEYSEKNISLSFLNEKQKHELAYDIIKSSDFQIVKDLVLLRSLIGDTDYISYINAHLLGLFVYHLYDKLIDRELDSNTLPSLITVHREFINTIRDLASGSCQEIMKEIDNILSETDKFYKNMGVSNYTDHFKKSIGICIIPLIVMPEYKTELCRFFKHYQLARQLADDLKDLDQDLKQGKETTMSSFMSKAYEETAPQVSQVDINKVFAVIEEELDEAKLSIEHIDTAVRNLLTKYTEKLSKKIDHFRFELAVLKEMRKKFNSRIISNSMLP